jgi:hypothetical protein
MKEFEVVPDVGEVGAVVYVWLLLSVRGLGHADGSLVWAREGSG